MKRKRECPIWPWSDWPQPLTAVSV